MDVTLNTAFDHKKAVFLLDSPDILRFDLEDMSGDIRPEANVRADIERILQTVKRKGILRIFSIYVNNQLLSVKMEVRYEFYKDDSEHQWC